MDDLSIPNSPPSLKQKLRNYLCFSCCFPHRRPPPPPQPLSSDENPALIWVNNDEPPNLKNKVLAVLNLVGNGSNRHKRYSSTEFRYDPLSYSLNFEEEEQVPLRNFSSRLPPSPPLAASS